MKISSSESANVFLRVVAVIQIPRVAYAEGSVPKVSKRHHGDELLPKYIKVFSTRFHVG